MTPYEKLLELADSEGLKVVERDLWAYDGLIRNKVILIRSTIPTQTRKAEILCEEIAHYFTTVGNILDQSIVENRKQERKARGVCYDKMISLKGLVAACNRNCQSLYEASEFLNVTPEFLSEALEYYKSKYSPFVVVDNQVLHFEPCLWVEDS